MVKVTLHNGVSLDAYLFTWHASPAQIHIYPAKLGLAEIYQLFDDPEALQTITVEAEVVDPATGEKHTKTTVQKGYTELFSIQRSMYHPDEKEFMIWLQRPQAAAAAPTALS